jgi:hypothetical protein
MLIFPEIEDSPQRWREHEERSCLEFSSLLLPSRLISFNFYYFGDPLFSSIGICWLLLVFTLVRKVQFLARLQSWSSRSLLRDWLLSFRATKLFSWQNLVFFLYYDRPLFFYIETLPCNVICLSSVILSIYFCVSKYEQTICLRIV